MIDTNIVSFIVPCYNEADTIELCLNSIYEEICNLNFECEVVVVDCGSNDGSINILSNYPVILRTIDKENRSYAKAVNEGVYASRGEYIQIVDSDSILAHGWIEKAIKHIKSDSNIGAVAGIWGTVSSDVKNNYLQSQIAKTTASKSKIWQSLGGPQLYRRSVYLENPMDSSLPGSVDVDQIVKIRGSGYKTIRIAYPMLLQVRSEYSEKALLKKYLCRYGIGSGVGMRKCIFENPLLVPQYVFAKKWLVLLGMTAIILSISISIFILSNDELAKIMLVISLIILTAAYFFSCVITKSVVQGFKYFGLKLVSSLGFYYGLFLGKSK